MYFQREYLRQAASQTLGTTYQVDLPKNGLLMGMVLYISGTQASGFGQDGGDWRIVDKITKVEIIGDGAQVIKSLQGKQAQGIGFLDTKVTMPDMWRNYAANSQRCYIPLLFGRKMFDLNYGLDLSKWKNVELKITNNAAAASFANLSVDIMCYYLRDAAVGQFGGYMASEQWRQWVPVAGETKYLEIPSDWLVRRIILNPVPGRNTGSTGEWYDTCNNLMYEIELAFNTGVNRVWKDGFQMLMACNYLEHGAYALTQALTYLNADKALDMGLGYTFALAGMPASKSGSAATIDFTVNADISSNIPKTENYQADICNYWLTTGMGYQNMGVFAFDIDPNPANWLNTKEKDVVKLDIATRSTATVTSCYNNVVLERLVR